MKVKSKLSRQKNIIIATRSQTTLFPGVKVDGEKIITYREGILQEKLPTSMIIIGAGAIGLEFATFWNSYGTAVTIVEMLPIAHDTAEIMRMSVASTLRSSGLGSAILQHLCDYAKTTGIQKLVFETTSTWQEVVEFYFRFGFQVTPQKEGDTYFVLNLQ